MEVEWMTNLDRDFQLYINDRYQGLLGKSGETWEFHRYPERFDTNTKNPEEAKSIALSIHLFTK